MNFKIMDDGIALDAVLSMPQREGKVPLCIIIHGFTGNKEEIQLIAFSNMMNELGMATLRVDMYGHGLSGGVFRDHTLFKWLSNVMTILDYVKTMPEISRIYLVGHSQGGLTAVLAGAMEKDRVSGLIPLSPALMIPEEARRGVLLGNKLDLCHLEGEFSAKDGWILGGNYVRVAQTINVEDAIKRFDGPVLIVQGEADKSVPEPYVKEKAKLFADCRYVSIPDETHCYDNHLDTVVEVLRNYILEKKWNE